MYWMIKSVQQSKKQMWRYDSISACLFDIAGLVGSISACLFDIAGLLWCLWMLHYITLPSLWLLKAIILCKICHAFVQALNFRLWKSLFLGWLCSYVLKWLLHWYWWTLCLVGISANVSLCPFDIPTRAGLWKFWNLNRSSRWRWCHQWAIFQSENIILPVMKTNGNWQSYKSFK